MHLKNVKEWIKITKIDELYEQEKLEAIQQAIQQARRESAIKYALSLIKLGHDDDVIIEILGLTRVETTILREAQEAIQQTKKGICEQAKRECAIKFAGTLIKLGHTDDIVIAETGLSSTELALLRG